MYTHTHTHTHTHLSPYPLPQYAPMNVSFEERMIARRLKRLPQLISQLINQSVNGPVRAVAAGQSGSAVSGKDKMEDTASGEKQSLHQQYRPTAHAVTFTARPAATLWCLLMSRSSASVSCLYSVSHPAVCAVFCCCCCYLQLQHVSSCCVCGVCCILSI